MISNCPFLLIAVLPIVSGIGSHLLFWIRGEWDAYSGHILFSAFLAPNVLAFVFRYAAELNLFHSYALALWLELFHILSIFTSIVIYRIYFHRLSYFPGPLSAKIWIWDIFYRTWRSGNRQSMVIDALHAKYGPIVRYAPDRLSVNFAAAVPLVHGTGSSSQCTKSVVYLNPVNGGSINAERDVALHHARRKVWERALSARALPNYIPPLTHLTSLLVYKLHAMHTKPTRVNTHAQLFTFDAMGLVGFGREEGFRGLTTGILNPAIKELIDMMNIGVYMMLVPWLHVLLDYVPTMGIIYKPDELFREFARGTLTRYCEVADDKRTENNDEEKARPTSLHEGLSYLGAAENKLHFKDIFSQIHSNPNLDDRRILSDCVLLSIAGADTTTSSLVHTIYRLARHPQLQAKIYAEMRLAKLPNLNLGSRSSSDLEWEEQFAPWIGSAKLPYLEAFIREVLRLHPPAPTGLPRLSPDGGFTIPTGDGSGTFIPGGTNVSIPVYTLLRDARNFARPLDFFPERFLPASHQDARADLVTDSRAYIPFLQGPYGCAGKQLAYLEIKIVIAGLLSAFCIKLPADGLRGGDDDDDGQSNSKHQDILHRRMETEWHDYSTVKAADIDLCFVPRDLAPPEERNEKR